MNRKTRNQSKKSGWKKHDDVNLITDPIYYINSSNQIAILKIEEKDYEKPLDATDIKRHIATPSFGGSILAFNVGNQIKERAALDSYKEKLKKQEYQSSILQYASQEDNMKRTVKGGYIPIADIGQRESTIAATPALSHAERVFRRWGEFTRSQR